jgi:hypothetical protein
MIAFTPFDANETGSRDLESAIDGYTLHAKQMEDTIVA